MSCKITEEFILNDEQPVRGTFTLQSVAYLVPFLGWFEVRIGDKASRKTENLECAN